MNALDLKRQITLGQRLSPLPEAAVLLLRLQHPTPSLQAALVHLATSDPDLAAELLAGVGLSPGEGTLSEAIARLDIAALRRIVFRCTLPRLFPLSGASQLDRHEFWRHSMATAALGEALARRVGNSWLDHVYVACLIHDIGKLILDDAMPEQYARARERTRTEGMFALEAERREMGVDHTLAGKWLAEAWRLPDEYVAAVWFHHHPVGGLDETDYPVGLIDLVALADQLVYENRLGAASAGDASERDTRVQRLGLGEEEVEEILRDSDQRRQQRVPVPDTAGRVLVPRANPQNVERKLHRLGILSNLHLQFEPGITEEQVMQSLAAAVREAFLVASGSIVLVGEGGATRGYLWKAVTGQLERFDYPVAQSGDAAEDPFLRLVRALGASDEGASAAMTTIPILGQGQRLGHVIFDAARSDLGNRQEDYDELVAFARAGGNALLYARAESQLRQRTEELASSLWKEEMAHRRRLRAERLSIIGRMSAGAAHEINNPLAVIMGRAQMLLNRAQTQDEVKSLEVIAEQSLRVSRILSDLMQFARPPRPRLQPVQVNAVVQAVVAARREQLNLKRIHIVEEYGDPLPRVRLDRYQMEQVLVQLFVNAEQAMEDAGGTLRIVTLGGDERRSVQIRIEDTGSGMTPEVLEHCFEPFFTTRRPGQGTGLGLSVCHGIVEAHGGSVSVISAPQKGTTAVIHLPAVADLAVVADAAPIAMSDEGTPASVSAAQESGAAESAREARILLVGHDADLRQVLEEILRYRGYSVTAAATGLEAFSILARRKPDLVLLDLDLPNHRGLHLLREIRQRTGVVPIVALAAPTTADTEEVLRQGARALFHKPFEMARLLSEIQGLLRFRAA